LHSEAAADKAEPRVSRYRCGEADAGFPPALTPPHAARNFSTVNKAWLVTTCTSLTRITREGLTGHVLIGTNINFPASQTCRQASILPFPANCQAQLVIRHNRLGNLQLRVGHRHAHDLRGAE